MSGFDDLPVAAIPGLVSDIDARDDRRLRALAHAAIEANGEALVLTAGVLFWLAKIDQERWLAALHEAAAAHGIDDPSTLSTVVVVDMGDGRYISIDPDGNIVPVIPPPTLEWTYNEDE